MFATLLILATPLLVQNETKWDPACFADTSKWAKVTAFSEIDKISFEGNESILDIGTGDGKIASIIASKVPRGKVIGIDSSQEMISYARIHFPRQNLIFEVGHGMHYKTQERFDLITSFTVLHLMSDPQKAFKLMAELLKPSGRVLLKFPIADGFGKALEQAMQHPKWKEYFIDFNPGWYFHSKQEYEKLALNAGLNVKHIEEGILDECYESKQELLEAVSQWLPHHHILPRQLQKAFLEELISLHLHNVPPDETGKVHHYEPFLCIDAFLATR